MASHNDDELPEVSGPDEELDSEDAPLADEVAEAEAAAATTGFITDYISGKRLRATPEEVEAVQVFARRLVEDYGYPREHLQTRPQFRVRRRPSDERKSYPVDICVFSSPQRIEGNLYIIVECKKKHRNEGLEQLKEPFSSWS